VPSLVTGLIEELAAEEAALDARVAGLDEGGWRIPTPAEGWTVADSVSHLCYFEEQATLALTDPAAFARHAEELRAYLMSGVSEDGEGPDVAVGRSGTGADLLERWRRARTATLAAALEADEADPRVRVPWYGPPMSLASFLTARLMETWAHGVDVGDALGLPPVATDRLRHVCTIGIKARPYAFAVHGVDDPGDPVRFEVTAPGGDLWVWGPEDTAERVTGPALDLALLLTQRRHRADTDLRIEGATARAWMGIAQAFAGPAGPGRPPLAG
jgi:uncharacterized protein (TIGR03084 family)